jgi:sugar phosphate isomerase/epimerase
MSCRYGIKTAIIHPHHFLLDNPTRTLRRSAESLKHIINSKPEKMNLAVENLPRSQGSRICAGLLEMFDQTQIGLCYDSSHENISGEPFHLLKKYGSRLYTCHLSDNKGENDDHFIPGDGIIDWPELKCHLDSNDGFCDILFEVGTGERLTEAAESFLARTFKRAEEIFG